MGFSNLIFLITAIFPVIVLIYYFFRKKYTDQPVSSTIFWDEVMQETKASPYLKHLQKNALLYLQLLALILFVLALMNPFIKTTEIAGEQAVWIVDTSATMAAGKETSTFEKHKEEMRALVPELSGRPLTIITTGEVPTTIVRQETEPSILHKAIDGLEITYEEEQLSKAIDMAQAFIGESATSIYLFTDSVDRKELPIENEQAKWIVKGADKDLQNIAITRFAATSNGDSTLALVLMKNETNEEKSGQLIITDENEQVLVEESVTLEANNELSKTFDQLPAATVLSANIVVEDDYQEDNTMLTLIGNSTTQIVVDQQMHQLLQKGFQSLNTDVKIAPSDQLLEMSNDAIVVTNQTELLKKAKSPIVLFGRDDEIVEEVNSLVNVSKDPLFAFSSLEDVFVNSIYPPIEGFETIATIGEKPFIQRSNRGDIAILADIQATDWPLHPSFPLFLWSLQNELLEGTETLGTFSPNDSRAVALTPGEWTMYSADDEYIATVENAGMFKAPTSPGVYSIRSDEEEKQFIVQLSSRERTIEEGSTFELGTLSAGGDEETSKKSLLTWLLLPILLLLVVEWEVQRRRGFTN